MFLPVGLHRRHLVAADGADDLANRPFMVDVRSHGKGNPTVVFRDIFAPAEFPLDFVVLRQMLHNAHLGRLLRLDKPVAVSSGHLRKGLLRDDAQIIRIVQKSPVHGF